MYIGLRVKYWLLLSDFMKLEFLSSVSKKTQILNFMKIRPVGAELTEGRTDMTKRRVAFRKIAKSALKTNVLC